MPSLRGIIETSLYVADLERSVTFYRRLFDLPVLTADARLCAMSIGSQDVLLLFQQGASTQALHTDGGVIPGIDGRGPVHVGFAVEAAEFPEWERRLDEQGITIEGRMHWARGGESLYFRDPDGHLLELLTPGVWAVY